MSETETRDGRTPPAPRIKKRSGPSLVWLVPLITAIIGGWLIVKTLAEKGPEITITFKSAEGIEAGKTKIKYKNVDVGVVEQVLFADDFSHIVLRAVIAKEAETFLRRNTRLWVVKPRLGLRGVTGLSTLISGAYIELEPGQGTSQSHFVGLEIPPVIKAEDAGTKIVLASPKLGSVDTGSPIYYQGILAGEVLGYELGNDQKSVFIHAFVKAPYNKLVKGNTRFWNVSGVDVSVSSEGVNVRTESIQSMLFGGIAFETPDTLEEVKTDVEGLIFTLHDDQETIQEQAFTKKVRFVLFFDGSVRGLNVGAPVEFKGIKIGSVVDVRLEFNREDTSFRIPVLVEIEPERVIERNDGESSSPYETLKTLVDRGLRARLQTGSLLTGQLFVEMDMHPETPIRLVNAGGPFPELPTIPGSLDEITQSVKSFMTKLEKVDIDRIGAELLGTLEGANQLVHAPELRNSLSELKGSLGSLRSILAKLDHRVEPLTLNLEKALVAGHQTLGKAETTMELVNTLLKPDSPVQFRYIQLAEELAETARSIRVFMDMLERNPESLLYGKNPPRQP